MIRAEIELSVNRASHVRDESSDVLRLSAKRMLSLLVRTLYSFLDD